MPNTISDTATLHQIELIISRLDRLSILPSVAASLFSKLGAGGSSPSELFEMVETEPSLAAMLFGLMHRESLSYGDDLNSLGLVLDKVPGHIVRDEFFSLEVVDDSGANAEVTPLRQGLVVHSIATGCCAKEIAQMGTIQIDSHLAYLGGLLHDIGKLALAQAMPKSFERIVEEAKSQEADICSIERKYLGCDHTIIGKRLSEKWHFPKEIGLGIWLHHCRTGIICEDMPDAGIAQVVQLADLIVRRCGIGQSGSYDECELPVGLVDSVGLSSEQLEQISRDLPRTVKGKCSIVGLDTGAGQANYSEIIHDSAVQLSKQNSELTQENRRLRAASSHFGFITDFLGSIDSVTAPIEAAQRFAVLWQKFYQTGTVCLYLACDDDSQMVEAIVVESESKIQTLLLEVPSGVQAIPAAVCGEFGILNGRECGDWLFEQLEAEFRISNTRLVPLLSGGRAIGAVIFEMRLPVSTEEFEESLKASVSIAGLVFDTSFGRRRQQSFAERFARLAGSSQNGRSNDGKSADLPVDALAEMAAGAAHELNNPLVVITGRTQLLRDAETDDEKKRILGQIETNAKEASDIVGELMGFARPSSPKTEMADIKEILDEAIELTKRKSNAERLDVQIDMVEERIVFVDSAQIASAIANVLCNCLESYSDAAGPIQVAVVNEGEFMKLEITDFGCGMDEQTVRKARYPFFSAKPAGRKRGMGLAYADRLVELNKGTLKIKSQLGVGTTVTIILPCRAE